MNVSDVRTTPEARMIMAERESASTLVLAEAISSQDVSSPRAQIRYE
jgi:hypothetical protein